MTWIIAKKSGGADAVDWHLWREGPRILEFETRFEAMQTLTELASQFGVDNLMLMKKYTIKSTLEVND